MPSTFIFHRGLTVSRTLLAGGVIGLALACAAPVLAVHPGHWIHATEADFAQGKTQQTVLTSLNQIKLAAATTPLAQLPDDEPLVYDLQAVRGVLYAAAGTQGKVYALADGKLVEKLHLEGREIFALDTLPNGDLLIAASGDAGCELLDWTPQETKVLVELPADVARYVWDMTVVGPRVYLATGTDGRLLEVDLTKLAPPIPLPADTPATPSPAPPDQSAVMTPSPLGPDHADTTSEPSTTAATTPASEPALPAGVRLLYHAKQANLLCITADAQRHLYLGTDTDGLVYRVTLPPEGAPADTAAQVFVMFDAGEPEIGALLVTKNGDLYVGAADNTQATPGRMNEPASEPAGQPDGTPPHATPAAAPHGDGQAAPGSPGSTGNNQPSALVPAHELAVPSPMPALAHPVTHDTLVPAVEPTGADEAGVATSASPGQEPTNDNEPGGPAMDEPDTPQEPANPAMMPWMAQGGGMNGPMMGGMPHMNMQPGNAVYRIDARGFVHEVFRESVTVLRLVQDDQGRLLIATGNEGQLYRFDPATEETTRLADLDCKQIPAMALGPDGSLVLGTANPAKIVQLENHFAKEGRFTSPTLDANQISQWGRLHLTALVPAGTTLAVQTRSGNVQDPEHAAWSPWSDAVTFAPDARPWALAPRPVKVASPPARFLQYRMAFTSDGSATPSASAIDLAYVTPNLKPIIMSLKATHPNQPLPTPVPMMGGGPGVTSMGNASGGGGNGAAIARAFLARMQQMNRGGGNPGVSPGSPGMGGGMGGGMVGGSGADIPELVETIPVDWEATDPNDDQLIYKLEYQPLGTDAWVLIADKLPMPHYDWPIRRVPDGRYLLRVTASDAPDNPPDQALSATRVSDPVVVDNTPPRFENVQVRIDLDHVTLTAAVSDDLSPIQEVKYTPSGSDDDWQAVTPADGIYDSTSENVAITIARLKTGTHVVTLRALDALGNAAFHNVLVNVPAPAGQP